MSTKAEVLASIEAINMAVSAAARVASELTDTVTPPPVDPVPPVITEPMLVPLTGSLLVIRVPVGTTGVKWTLVQNDDALPDAQRHYQWYGPVYSVNEPVDGHTIDPQYAHDTDFVKLIWDGGSTDGPKDTQAVPPPVVVPPVGSANAAKRFVARMLAGINLERRNFLGTRINGATPKNKAFYDYHAQFGINWFRYFAPVNYTFNRGMGVGIPGDLSAVDELLDCALAANLGRYPVVFGALDIIGDAEMEHQQDCLSWVDLVAKRVNERAMDPELFAMETCNEMAGGDNNRYNAFRIRLHETIRNRLPNHRIVHGASDWNGIPGWNDSWQAPPDLDVVLQFHAYAKKDDWSGDTGHMADFGAKYGVPAINGELGDDFGHMDQEAHQVRWAENFAAYGRTANKVPVCAWANIGGYHDFKMNRSDTDGRLTAILENGMKAGSDAFRTGS